MNGYRFFRRAVIVGAIVLAAGGIVYCALNECAALHLSSLVTENTRPSTLIILFFILPLVGFPISVFLILLGARFDPAPAMLIMFSGMAFHQGITFPAGNALLRPLIERLLARRSISLPQFPARGFVWPCIVFMAVPGLSYTMKNYILSLSGIPFRYFFLIAWLVQAVMGIPMVLAGDAIVGRHTGLLLALIVLMAVIYGVRFWVIRRRRNNKG